MKKVNDAKQGEGKVSAANHTPTPYQIHFLGDNARTELEKCYPFVVVEKSDYHNWAEELPSGDDILAYFADQPTALKFVRAVNSYEALLEAAKDALRSFDVMCDGPDEKCQKCYSLVGLRASIAQAEGGK